LSVARNQAAPYSLKGFAWFFFSSFMHDFIHGWYSKDSRDPRYFVFSLFLHKILYKLKKDFDAVIEK
ncbi:hypothetical protein MHH45_27890, partial [Bacillus sp. FSL K6-0042]